VKLPLSVLVVVHTASLEVLLLERESRAGFWQSVTGSLDRMDEPLAAAAAREVAEETGIDAAAGALTRWPVANTFEIYARWRHRFAPGVTHNTEHVFGLALAAPLPVRMSPQEHTVCLAAVAGGSAEMLLLVEPRRHPDVGRKSAVII
jgi:dATP pyrophosphohydrolase